MMDGRRFRQAGASGARAGCRGFTILEIVVVLLLLGVVAVAAFNRLGGTSARAVAEADALRSVLRYAQSRAMSDVYTWGLTLSSSGYTLFSNNPGQTNPVLPGQGGSSHSLPSGVSLGGSTLVMFDWRGEPVSTFITTPGGSATVVSSTQTVTVSDSGQSVTVTVTPYTGFVP